MPASPFKILGIVGTRPNFVKIAPLQRAFLANRSVDFRICHTSQHWAQNMTDIFFEQLELPQPDHFLKVDHRAKPIQQMAQIMDGLAQVFSTEKPHLAVVVGDVNSTLAAALTAQKMGIPLAHVEAGLRSGDRTMPEEINRILTDQLADLLFVTEKSGLENLEKEGHDPQKIHHVGNVMIDSLAFSQKRADALALEKVAPGAGLEDGNFLLVTMHRPENVDAEPRLLALIDLLGSLARGRKIVFPVHPRTEKNLKSFGLWPALEAIEHCFLLPPIGYFEFVRLMGAAAAVITDSGGVQEETAWLGASCLTLRRTTERPSTVEAGTNFLLKNWTPEAVLLAVEKMISAPKKRPTILPLWDGRAAERAVKICIDYLKSSK